MSIKKVGIQCVVGVEIRSSKMRKCENRTTVKGRGKRRRREERKKGRREGERGEGARGRRGKAVGLADHRREQRRRAGGRRQCDWMGRPPR